MDAKQGCLSRTSLYKALALVAWAQQGKELSLKLLDNFSGDGTVLLYDYVIFCSILLSLFSFTILFYSQSILYHPWGILMTYGNFKSSVKGSVTLDTLVCGMEIFVDWTPSQCFLCQRKKEFF